ncbi:MAG: hypothetical protein ACFFA0_05610 [Promethearchaeota archaeon]
MRILTKNMIVLFILGFIFGCSILTNSNFKIYQEDNYVNLEGDTTDNDSQENDILKSSNGEINLITPEDKVYYKPMSGYYSGTNSFDHDEVGTEPTWFQEVGTVGGTVQVIEELDGHKTVLELHDTNETDYAYVLKNLLMFPRNGTIEFWMRTDNTSKPCGFCVWGGIVNSTIIIALRTWSNIIQYWNGSDWIEIENRTIQNDEWFHVRIDFECSNGGYQGLAKNYCKIFINGGRPQVFLLNDNKSCAVQIQWLTDGFWGFSDYYYYIDAIAFSWIDRCNIADNMNDGLLLKFQAPSNLTWIGYSLNDLDNITILGESAIPKPGNGNHSIQVFGKDSEDRVYKSELRYFEVNNPTLVLIPGVGGNSEMLLNGITSPTLDLNDNETSDFIDYYGAQNIINISYYNRHTPRTEFDDIQGAWFTSIKDIANAVKNYIVNEFNAGNIKKNIDLLCWSYGGVVTRTMIKEHYSELKKAGITIIHVGIFGTPNHGSWFANLGYFNAVNNGSIIFRHLWQPNWEEKYPLNLYTLGVFLEYLNSGDETPYNIYYNTYRGYLLNISGSLEIDPHYDGRNDSIKNNLDEYNEDIKILVNQSLFIIGNYYDGAMTTDSVKLSGAVNNRAYLGLGHEAIINFDTVQKDILWDLKHYPEVGIDVKSPMNQTYTKPSEGYYPGTNSFDHDEVGCQPAWFLEVGTDGGTVYTIEELDGHKTVLELHDTNETQNVRVIKNIPIMPSKGTVEFWMRSDNISKVCGFYLSGGINFSTIISVVTWLDTIRYWNGTEYVNITNIQNDEWIHVRLDFECTSGNYSGLDQYSWCIYINGIRYGNFPFIEEVLVINRIVWLTDWYFGFSNYYYYIDAIGFSWDNNYNIGDNINEGLLLSFDKNFEHSWISCSLDGGAANMVLGDTSIPLPDDGVHSIQVFSEEWSGDVHQSEVIYFTMDTSAPEITINSPNRNDLFGILAPAFELSIFDLNLADTWYTLDGGITNITFTGLTLTINETEWDKMSNGTVSIRFFANDSWGFEGFIDIILRKDAYVPDITLHSPLSNETFGKSPPEFNISIVEEDLVSTWYIIEGIAGNFYFTEFTGTINEDLWNVLPEGEIIITFHAVDRAGNEGIESVMVLKSISSRPAVIGYNFVFLFGILSVISLIISVRIRKYGK